MIATDFSMGVGTDNIVTINMVPPVAIAGWSIKFWCCKRFGGKSTPLFEKWYASGYNGVSGITIVNSGEGIFNVRINAVDTSGFDAGNYANGCDRLSSGAVTQLSEGFLNLVI